MQTKEKLVRPNVRQFTNEMLFRFATENGNYYRNYNPDTLGIASFMPEFEESLEAYDHALEQVRKSPETERIAVLDGEFDRTFSGLSAFAETALKHYDESIRHAAENLHVIFKHYGNIGRQPYRQELASSYNLLQELEAHPNDVAKMGLAPWMQAHKDAAEKLAHVLDIRTDETAQRPDVRAAEARRCVENVYQKITDRIDAVINLNGKDYLGGFYDVYNAHATEYKNTLAQHLGRIHKKLEE